MFTSFSITQYSNLSGAETTQEYSPFVYRGHIYPTTEVNELRTGIYCTINSEMNGNVPYWFPENIFDLQAIDSLIEVYRRNNYITIRIDTFKNARYTLTWPVDDFWPGNYALKNYWTKSGSGYTLIQNDLNVTISTVSQYQIVSLANASITMMDNCNIYDIKMNDNKDGFYVVADGNYMVVMSVKCCPQTNDQVYIDIALTKSSSISDTNPDGIFINSIKNIPANNKNIYSTYEKTVFQHFNAGEEIKLTAYVTGSVKILTFWFQIMRL